MIQSTLTDGGSPIKRLEILLTNVSMMWSVVFGACGISSAIVSPGMIGSFVFVGVAGAFMFTGGDLSDLAGAFMFTGGDLGDTGDEVSGTLADDLLVLVITIL